MNQLAARLLAAAALVTGSVSFAAPTLRLSTTAVGPVSLAQGQNGTAPAVDAFNAGDGSLSLTLSSSVSWINATVGSPRACSLGANCLPINFALQTSALARGIYTGVVTVSDANAVDAPQTITVTVQVGGGVPESVNLFAAPGGTAEAPFTTNAALESRVSTSGGGNWLALALDGAGSFRFSYPYRVVANAGSLDAGSYSGSIVTSGSSLAADNRTIAVNLRVTTDPIAQASTQRLTFRLSPSAQPQTGFVTLANRGQGTLSITGATATTASGGNWLAVDRPAGFPGVSVTANPSGLAPGVYQGSVSIAANAANAPVSVAVELLVVAAGAPVSFFNGVVNNATFAAGDTLAQGAIVALFGEQLTNGAPRSATALPLTTDLGGTRVLINNEPAPVYFVSYNQVNFQVPYTAPTGDVQIRVEREGQRGNPVSARIGRAAPRLLRLGIREYGIIVNQDGTFPIPATPGVASRPARPGDALVIYAIGFGQTSPAATSGAASPTSPLAGIPDPYIIRLGTGVFGGTEVTPFFVGLTPGFVGLYQVNFIVPEDANRGDEIPLTMAGPAGESNRVTLAIQ